MHWPADQQESAAGVGTTADGDCVGLVEDGHDEQEQLDVVIGFGNDQVDGTFDAGTQGSWVIIENCEERVQFFFFQ